MLCCRKAIVIVIVMFSVGELSPKGFLLLGMNDKPPENATDGRAK